jgi:hypothetical protein
LLAKLAAEKRDDEEKQLELRHEVYQLKDSLSTAENTLGRLQQSTRVLEEENQMLKKVWLTFFFFFFSFFCYMYWE